MYKQKKVGQTSTIEYEDALSIGKNVVVHENVLLRGRNIHIGNNVIIGKNTSIFSMNIKIGDRTQLYGDTRIIAYERLRIGTDCKIRRGADFKARSIEIGDFFFSDDNPIPLVIGGGGSDYPTAHIKIGKRCVMHDSFINVCMPVTIGDDVGFSPQSIILTHGFWNSVIEGYSRNFAGVKIGNKCIIGYGATILMGVELGDYVSVGARAVVTKSFPSYCVIAGVPAKIIKSEGYPKEMSFKDKINKMREILREYAELLKDKIDEVEVSEGKEIFTIYGKYGRNHFRIVLGYPSPIKIRTIILVWEDILLPSDHYYLINFDNYTWKGKEDEITDDLRDFLRHYGIRIFSKRGFKTIPHKLKRKLLNPHSEDKSNRNL